MSGNVWMFSDEIDDEDLEFMSHDYVTYNMACEYYRLGIKPVVRMAHEAGAVYKIGKAHKFQFYGMFCIRIIVFILILHIRHLNGVVNHQHKQRFIVLLLVLRNLIEMKKDCFQQKRRARLYPVVETALNISFPLASFIRFPSSSKTYSRFCLFPQLPSSAIGRIGAST